MPSQNNHIPLASTSTSNIPSSSSSSIHQETEGAVSQPLNPNSSGSGGGGEFSQTNPTTPIDILTPHLSNHPSPDTPGLQLQTPYSHSKEAPSIYENTESESMDTEIRMKGGGGGGGESLGGLGYSVHDIKGKGRLGREEEIETSDKISSGEGDVEEDEGEKKDRRYFPSEDELSRMRERLETLRASSSKDPVEREELVGMVESLLTPATQQLPFLNGQIAAQRETIRTLQEQAKLSYRLSKIERDRHTAERHSLRVEMQALLKVRDAEIAAGTRPRKVLDLDVGYHQELEAANKRLEMDNRLMAPRLADTQRQIDKLVTELRHLRSHVVLSSEPMTSEPTGSREKQRALSPSKPANQTTTMGDARTEHLLLAARKVRSMRADNDRVGRLTLEELKRGGVVGPDGGIGYSEGYGGVVEEESEEEVASDEDDPIFIASGVIPKGKGKAQTTPLLPRPKKPMRKAPPTTPRTSGRTSGIPPETTTPGGSNFSDLLRAAELATRPTTPTPEAPGRHEVNSRKRKGGSEHEDDEEEEDEDDNDQESDPVFALGLLAQASQLNAAQSQDSIEEERMTPSQRTGGGMMKRERSPTPPEGGLLAPAIDLRDIHNNTSRKDSIEDAIDPSLLEKPTSTSVPVYQTPILPQHPPPPPPAVTPVRNRKLSISSDVVTPRIGSAAYYDDEPPTTNKSAHGFLVNDDLASGAFASPTGGTVPGLGKYVHLTSNVPARRVRSPYLKWTVEEDELLARAVAIHGEKWDMVSKGVPTRSYHQVRQRWLRKTGAFDKKPMTEGEGDMMMDEEKEISPTPRTPASKKRKT